MLQYTLQGLVSLLEKKAVTSIKLKTTYLNLQNALGQISIGRIRLDQQSADFDKAEDNIRNQFSEAQTKEKEFLESINKKYGDGNLDITTGVFTPKSTEKK